MLTRAARQRHNLRHVQHAADQLQLPWLCPALSRIHTSSSTSEHRPSITRDRASSRRTSTPLPTHARRLASAAPLPGSFHKADAYLNLPYKDDAVSQPSRPRVSSEPQLDISKILMIDNTTSLPPERLDTNRVVDFDIRGSAYDIEATLEACLQVQRWDRAFSILGQLPIVYQKNPTKLLQAYNRVLEAMVFDHILNRNPTNVQRINKWVEVDMANARVNPDAQTFALKIKAAITTLTGTKRDRTVRRYWELAQAYGVDWEVASLRQVLSDSDLGKLGEICPIRMDDVELEPEIEEEGETMITSNDVVSEPATAPVRETSQKGLGMVSLKQSLSLFNNTQHLDEWHQSQSADEDTREAYSRQRQTRLEQDALKSALDRWKIENDKRQSMGISTSFATGKVGTILWNWHKDMADRIADELKKVDEAEAKNRKSTEDRLRCEYGPFLRLLDPPQLAALVSISVMQTLVKSGVMNSTKLARLVTEVGRSVEDEVDAEVQKRRKEAMTIMKMKAHRTRSIDVQSATSDQKEQIEVREPRTHWSSTIHAKVGAILCDMFFDIAKVTIPKSTDEWFEDGRIEQAAFNRNLVYQNGRKVGIVVMNPHLAKMTVMEPVADLIAKQLPMVSKPRPWIGFHDGGYLESRSDVLRVKNGDLSQRDYAEAAAQRGDLGQLFASLDVLGATGWRINKHVFKVMLKAWNSGEEIANFPPLEKIFPETPKPAEDAKPRDKYIWYQKMRAINNERTGLHSNRCFQNFQMEIARAYLNDTFYLPHNVDFRGRAYPIPPYLNQMGADNARGLLIFEKGRPLGSTGLKWLKVHLANVYGYDKASLSDRAQFATEHLDEIRDSAEKPLDGRRWWLKAEDPWQFLAACHELIAALDSGDPENFVSHLPIHQDGTCNGLQHYAALGGDIAGARQVNLEPGDKPADVYTGVAELVKADIKEDAMNGLEIAKRLDGKVTRKIVKQTVMTNVYGVTFAGAIRQVRRQLDDLVPELNEQGQAGPSATYIARKIFKGLGTLFEGAHGIQYWFGDCANRITNSVSPAQMTVMEEEMSRRLTPVDEKAGKGPLLNRKKAISSKKAFDLGAFRSTVIWTTPLKLPVVQPYRHSVAQKVKTNLQKISLIEPSVTDSVDHRKQLQGFPPNFIHSLDATHMMLSALKAHESGLSFSAVHDSFWTHAADVDKLNHLLREAFIRMHSEDIVGRLAAEFEMRYKGHLYLARVGKGNHVGKAIKEYRDKLELPSTGDKKKRNARTSKAAYMQFELVKEFRRQKLLQSSNPIHVEEGRRMVTAASIYEEMNGHKYLTSTSSLGETALGHVPDANSNAVSEALTHEEEPGMHDVDMMKTLDPLVDADVDVDGDVDGDVDADVDDAVDVDAAAQSDCEQTGDTKAANGEGQAKPRRTPTRTANLQWLWLPMTFKEIPKKGEFKVERLRDSVYFFS